MYIRPRVIEGCVSLIIVSYVGGGLVPVDGVSGADSRVVQPQR